MEKSNTPVVKGFGKMHNWHRLITRLGMISCLLSGVSLFVAGDVLNKEGSDLFLLMSSHGVVGHLSLLVLGMALYHHVQMNWKMKKNRRLGALMIGTILVLMATILAMYYGVGIVHEYAPIAHMVAGILLMVVFHLHLKIGKKTFINQDVVNPSSTVRLAS
jgi:peptidoglycan/LPS O-acetylase OafA/YrhL